MTMTRRGAEGWRREEYFIWGGGKTEEDDGGTKESLWMQNYV